jgi:hypothetical protein
MNPEDTASGYSLKGEALQNIKFQEPNRGPAQRVGTPKEKT